VVGRANCLEPAKDAHVARLPLKGNAMRTLITSLAAFVAMSAIALAQHVTYDVDRSVDWHRFSSYAWVQGPASADSANNDRIVNAVTGELASKGFQRVAQDAGPDLLVAYHTSLDCDVKVTGLSKGWGPYQFGGRARSCGEEPR